MTWMGIDVGGTSTQVVVIDDGGAILADATAPTVRFDPRGLVRATIELAVRAMATAGVDAVDGVGVGIPGIVDSTTGTVVHAVNVGVTDEPLALGPAVAEALRCRVAMENDVRAAALEALALVAQGHPEVRDVVLVNLGTGVSAGIVADGRLVTGPRRTAGEIGHVPFGGDTPCACGAVGCLETVLSGPAIARRWCDGEAGDAAYDLFSAAEAGDACAEETAASVISDLVGLLQWLANTTGTAAFVLGGGVATAHPAILRRVQAAISQRTERSPVAARALDAAHVHVPPPGHPMGALGAAALARAEVGAPRRPTAAGTAAHPTSTVLSAGHLGRTQAPTHDTKEHR